MELPIVQFKTHRLAYTLAACFGLVPLGFGFYGLVNEDAFSFWYWMLSIVGFIISTHCGWTAISHDLILELNHKGIDYKKNLYPWNTLSSYAIRMEDDERGSYNYLILYFNQGQAPLEIQLDWMDDHESVPEQMAVYAKVFKVRFAGIIKK
ncbi:hypothetical protein [Pedobacter antarcticus]|uniref:hypothetical protein n=1 Tax=Pedobacter antarcticus TaxID=34086 RepID=UPI002931588B|nr:hypothetical protein [Pedobacter antarcticus]